MSSYKDWIKAIDIDIDYFSAFMKAWIAFNSWYRSEYGSGTDKVIIEKVKDGNDRFRSYMMNLLSSQEAEGIRYKESLANLHAALCNATITTQEYGGIKKQISFSEIAVKNTNRKSEHSFGQCNYQSVRSGNIIKTEVKHKTNGIIYLSFEQDTYNLEELTQQTDFINLSQVQRQQCEVCYKRLYPYLIESILFSGDTSLKSEKDKFVKMGVYNFINDNDKGSKAIIEVLYLLRCSLAHGDVAPDESSNNVYRYAYQILATTLKKLI